jgi:hypothetical protein
MPTTISTDALDRILALQLSVAWAGERHGDPPSLGWWETSLADPEGGGDFLQRMFPRTHVWAALGSMREAARRADAKAREQTARSDELITLFHFGFEWDEALQERFEHHKRQGVEPPKTDDVEGEKHDARDPKSVFGQHYAVASKFDRAAFEKYLGALAGKVAHESVPGGRHLTGPLPAEDEAAVQLARALLPLLPAYPLPFYAVPAGR